MFRTPRPVIGPAGLPLRDVMEAPARWATIAPADDVASRQLSAGEVVFELACRFRGLEDHHPYLWRLPWSVWLRE